MTYFLIYIIPVIISIAGMLELSFLKKEVSIVKNSIKIRSLIIVFLLSVYVVSTYILIRTEQTNAEQNLEKSIKLQDSLDVVSLKLNSVMTQLDNFGINYDPIKNILVNYQYNNYSQNKSDAITNLNSVPDDAIISYWIDGFKNSSNSAYIDSIQILCIKGLLDRNKTDDLYNFVFESLNNQYSKLRGLNNCYSKIAEFEYRKCLRRDCSELNTVLTYLLEFSMIHNIDFSDDLKKYVLKDKNDDSRLKSLLYATRAFMFPCIKMKEILNDSIFVYSYSEVSLKKFIAENYPYLPRNRNYYGPLQNCLPQTLFYERIESLF